VTPIPSAAGPPPGSEEPPSPPEFPATTRPWPGLDRLGLTQAIGGLALGLIALFSSYDHITFAGRVFTIPQQWGIPLIAASVAIVFVDAELETRARDRRAYEVDRAADEAKRAANEADRRENEADRERNRADQERNRAAEARERQAETAEHQNAALDLRRGCDNRASWAEPPLIRPRAAPPATAYAAAPPAPGPRGSSTTGEPWRARGQRRSQQRLPCWSSLITWKS
jgi:hypothetical protein